jgi:DNA-binding NarL/FixJ family response regulator
MKRLLIVADHSLILHAIRLALRQTTGFQILGCVDGRQPAQQRLVELQPDVVLIDDMHHRDDVLARLREVAEHAPTATSLLLTMPMDDEWLDCAFEAGASAVVSKTVHPVALGTLLREIVASNVVHRPRRPRTAAISADCPLTVRELEILRLAARGMTNGRIARELWVTEQTVKFHLSNTYRKLGVTNRTEATRYAYMNDLVTAHHEPRQQVAAV